MPEALSDACDLLKIPELSEYYHGYIDRTEAEKRLKEYGTPNSYLLRLSRIVHSNSKWESIYVLSYLSSRLDCYHFKLIPRLNCFQLGGRLFDCLQGCLSRYYVQDIMTGERLRHPVAPCSPPLEYHTQRLRAIQTFEPENSHDRLGCTVGDRFLLVHEDPKTDWLLVTSLKSRHSGYLPKCCVEKEYPDLIERLDFFHPDVLTSQPSDLLKKAGAYSYLLRPCDSLPGLYTLLLYDGVRVRKYRLELIIQSEPVCAQPPESAVSDAPSYRRSSEPNTPVYCPETPSNNGHGDTSEPHRSSGNSTPATASAGSTLVAPNGAGAPYNRPSYRAVTRVMYNGCLYDSVEQIVAVIEALSKPWHTDALPATPNGTSAEGDVFATPTSCSSFPSLLGVADKSLGHQRLIADDIDFTLGKHSSKATPVVFRPVRREHKPHPTPPSSAIYMALRSACPSGSQSTALEIHGKLSMLTQRKKWKSVYAQVDRKQGILTLKDGEKRKTGRYDLSKCDFFPVHPMMFDHHYCFGILPYGASVGDREELIFSVDSDANATAFLNAGAPVTPTAGTRSSSFQSYDLDLSTYAGRPEDQPIASASQTGLRCGMDWSTATANQSVNSGNDSTTTPTPVAASLDTIFSRWLRCIRLHCRNTKDDATNEQDMTRRQTHLRCYRTLDIKINNAKLQPSIQSKSKREEPSYFVVLDGIEIARAYLGTSSVSITFEEFPPGFKKIEILNKEENKRKRSVIIELELCQSNSDSASASDPNLPQIGSDDTGLSTELGVVPLRRRSSTICETRDRTSAQATISYKELHVLPFCYYEQFRHVLRNCLDTELVPLSIYVWKSLPTDVSRGNFVSTLLLVTTELKCHLQLIVNLLKTDIIAEQPNNSFRGNTLGSQMLDMYSNSVCSIWRNECFKRVREEAFNWPNISGSVTSLSHPSLSQTVASSIRTGNSGPRVTGTSGFGRPYSLSSGACVVTPSAGCLSESPSTSCSSTPTHTREQEWHCRLIAIAVDDLISHVRHFPLQVRWVYSKLQALHEDEQCNAVVCNLVFLRGLCPSLSSPPNPIRPSTSGCSLSSSFSGCSLPGPTTNINFVEGVCSGLMCAGTVSHSSSSQSSAYSPGSSSPIPSAAASALKLVAKTLLALVSLNVSTKVHSDNLLSPKQFMEYRNRLLNEFCSVLTSPLQASEVTQLDQLYEIESFRASCRSLSRELAILANHFLEVLNHQQQRFGTGSGSADPASSTQSGGHEFRLWDYSPSPSCPEIYSVLCNLEDRTKKLIYRPRSLCSLHK